MPKFAQKQPCIDLLLSVVVLKLAWWYLKNKRLTELETMKLEKKLHQYFKDAESFFERRG